MKLSSFVLAALISFPAYAGNELGNGKKVDPGQELGNVGDLVAQEFVAAGRRLVQELRAKPDPRIPDVEKFAQAVESVKVSTADSLTLHGNEVDAINFPEDGHIDVSRSRWEAYGSGKKASLVLHEYLGVMKLEDKNYEISSSYAETFPMPEMKSKKFELKVGTSYGLGQKFADFLGASRPGVAAYVGYALSTRSSVGFNFDSQRFDEGHGNYKTSNTEMELAAAYKYWLSLDRTLRPYIQVGVGFRQSKDDVEQIEDRTYYGETVTRYPGWQESALTFQIGAGYRYAILHDIGIDLGLEFHSFGTPWHNDGKTLVAKLGVDVLF